MAKTITEDFSLPTAKEHNFFFGHQTAEAHLIKALNSTRLHHAWLLEGRRGIGKATLAWRAARYLLAEQQSTQSLAIHPDCPTWHLTQAASHPDFLLVSPDENRKTPTITIDDIRQVNSFFTKSPALGTYRICIIDAVDHMNVNAANALLKLLEEPPDHSMFFLISHCIGSVLTTIRSRCQHLKLFPLSDQAISKLILAFFPDIAPADKQQAIALGDGSAGQALSFAYGEGKKLHHDFFQIVSTLPHLDHKAIQNFCATLADDHVYHLFCALMLRWIHQITTQTPFYQQGLTLWDEVNMLIQQGKRFNMDRKSTAQNIFLTLETMHP